ncbi:MAG: NADH-quinone oxidoreductase subunit J [Chloroflexi bacterium]|nr:NADH-quinone oxidoreductase subunit J [Chloroflexota bacterium]
MLFALIVAAAVLCAVQALRSARLLVSALWLAGTSALIALLLYLMGAHEVAVVELSVGAGLVTILFVFAISVAGDEVIDLHNIVPKPLAISLVVLAALLMAWLVLRQPGTVQGQPSEEGFQPAAETTVTALADALWQQRGLDALVQVVMIFSGVLGMLGLLAGAKTAHGARHIASHAAMPAGSNAIPRIDGHRVIVVPNANVVPNAEASGTFLNPKSTRSVPNPKSEKVR